MKIESTESGGFRLTCDEMSIEIERFEGDNGFLITSDDCMRIMPLLANQIQITSAEA